MSSNVPVYHNILLIHLRRIGDVMMTTPAIRAIRNKYPDSKITFITEAPSDQILKHNPYVNELIVFQRKGSIWNKIRFLWTIRQKHFDLVIDFFGNPRSTLMSWLSGSPRRIGFNFTGRKLFYTDCIDLGKEGQYSAQHKVMLLKPLGISNVSLDLDFFISDEDRQYADSLFQQMGLKDDDFVVSLSPVSRRAYKVWPPQYFSGLADELIEKFNAKILFIYGFKELHFVEQVRAKMHHQSLPNYDVPTLSQTKALFEKVDLHIGNDNGPRHFAIAAKIPTVAVFGKPKAINWTPPNQDQHQTIEYDPGCKNHCTYPKCEHLSCINDVDPQQVKKKMYHLIEQYQLGRRHV